MLFGVSPTLSDDLFGPSFSFGRRHLSKAAHRTNADALVLPFLLPWHVDAKPNIKSVAVLFHVTTLPRPTRHRLSPCPFVWLRGRDVTPLLSGEQQLCAALELENVSHFF
jgi:hypothetical protein